MVMELQRTSEAQKIGCTDLGKETFLLFVVKQIRREVVMLKSSLLFGHRQLRKDIQSRRRRHGLVQYDDKWGRWMPSRRFNVDQVPCAFVIDQSSTYDERGSKSVWISQPGNGLDKRQCTLQICICPEDDQPVPPAIIFRGKGNVSQKEKDAYEAGSRTHLLQQWIKK